MERLRKIITYEIAGIKLNLVTLSIDDSQANRDFEAHRKYY
jgi:hypothetical protein